MLTNNHLISFRLLINFLRDPNDQQIRLAFFPRRRRKTAKGREGKMVT